MRTIEIDEDVYAHLVRNTAEIGEDASSILRRLLGLSSSAIQPAVGPNETVDSKAEDRSAKLVMFVDEAAVHARRNVTDRFLLILRGAYEIVGPEFERVLSVAGRKRRYFSDSRDVIVKSGKSTHPQRIGSTKYWVMTNAPTAQKRDILARSLASLGFNQDAIRKALIAMGR